MKYLGLLLFAFTFSLHASWLDQSQSVFVPRTLQEDASDIRDFPVFWWNFIIIDISATSLSELMCARITERLSELIEKLPCSQSLANLKSYVSDWNTDTPRRIQFPPNLHQAMQTSLVKASLPIPSEALSLLRIDPLDSTSQLIAIANRHIRFNRPLTGGILFDHNRIIIPIQFNFPPNNSKKTKIAIDGLQDICKSITDCKMTSVLGPHGGSFENETQVRADIAAVSTAGAISTIALLLFLILTGRKRLVLLIPILALGVSLGALCTIAVFGSIHAIALSFGPGIIGLSLDYGVHAVFLDPRSKSTWRSNLAGLLTTLAILIFLLFSQIPLLKQLMFFSISGLCLSFILFFFILRRWPRYFFASPYAFSPKSFWPGEWFAIFLLAVSMLIFLKPIELSINQMNFESARTKEIKRWFLDIVGSQNPHWLKESSDDPLGSSYKTFNWAKQNGIEFDGLGAMLPPLSVQEQNLASWKSKICDNHLSFDKTEVKFFAPFLETIACKNLIARDIKASTPKYLQDFSNGKEWTSVLLPSTDLQVKLIKEKFPQAKTPREMFDTFPKVFVLELSWMIPLAMFSALVFLWWHFRNFKETFLATVPFLTGLGCYALTSLVLELPLTFIALIGLVMVFGFSLDYGIFVVDLLKNNDEGKFGVWSALSVCSFSSFAGFLPLIFAKHPVMHDLGQALFWGSIGTYLGTFWGISSFWGILKIRNKNEKI